ncbi:AAA family ATPase (plasmid) [Microbulbifer sp. ANSA001]|uniref:AAA family ATPase n=1 Tax=Microbulbifer sp. ANSA001 TaxID=3243358 RepID=UPI004042C995
MNLKETLAIAIEKSRALAKNIATAQFGDDSPEARKITRRWTITDAAALVGVSTQAIRKAEEAQRLPAPDMTTDSRDRPRRMGYTIYQIDNMRDVFGTRPGRGEASPQVIAIAGHKGGSLKTSTAVHKAQWHSLQGRKVLFMDIDPQATASLYFGYVADVNVHREDTALPYLLGERGNLTDSIKPTCWPNLDIIPSCLAMQELETELERRANDGELDYPKHMMLRSGLDDVMDAYDIIIIDGSPNLGMGTVNMICAADAIITPAPADLNDYMSTAQFFEALRDLLDGIDLGGFVPDLRVLITKYSHQPGSASAWMEEQIRRTWGGMVLNNKVSLTDEVSKGQVRMRTIYEQNTSQRSTPSAWAKAQSIWNPIFEEIMTRVIEPRWADARESAEEVA